MAPRFKAKVGPLQLTYSNPKGPNAPEKRRFVQVIVNCATECPLENCRGKRRWGRTLFFVLEPARAFTGMLR